MLKLKGDTLIEVTLAIGIFSMVAVVVVAVVNSSASSAQTALEITLAREEVDAQAEALRFIHSAYISTNGGGAASNGEGKYAEIWEDITKNAKDKTNFSEDILKYNPSTCDELYNVGKLADQGAFIINTKGLNNKNASDIIIRATEENGKFNKASTYPRIIYSNPYNNLLFTDEKESNNTNSIERVEGIYVIAVKDIDGTNIVADDSLNSKSQAAYYDFYIRTCWYGPGADHPSTISTVIRLYNPNIGAI